MANKRQPAAFGVSHRCHANQLDLRAAEQHGQRAKVIGIPADVGIEVNAEHGWSLQAGAPVPSEVDLCVSYPERFLVLSAWPSCGRS